MTTERYKRIKLLRLLSSLVFDSLRNAFTSSTVHTLRSLCRYVLAFCPFSTKHLYTIRFSTVNAWRQRVCCVRQIFRDVPGHHFVFVIHFSTIHTQTVAYLSQKFPNPTLRVGLTAHAPVIPMMLRKYDRETEIRFDQVSIISDSGHTFKKMKRRSSHQDSGDVRVTLRFIIDSNTFDDVHA
jgi:hypothetical protein